MQQVIVPISSEKSKRLILLASLTLAAVVLAAVAFLAWQWPFTRARVLKELEDASLSRVDAAAFHGTYFPRPGCALEHVRLQHNPKPGSPPLITVETIRIEGSFWDSSRNTSSAFAQKACTF
jgi:hypothetical protein